MSNTNCTHCIHGVRISRRQHERCEGCRTFVPGPVDAPAPLPVGVRTSDGRDIYPLRVLYVAPAR